VPDYADIAYVLLPTHQVVTPTPQDFFAHALPNGPTAKPGERWQYSNTGYTLIGMIIEGITGRTVGQEIADRIVAPLGLTRTFYAEPGQRLIPGVHVRGYFSSLAPVDFTNLEPAVWGPAGALVSSPRDMNTFISALLAGELLPPAQLAAMQDDVPYGTGGYGLGIVRIPLSCGEAWGHAGFLTGYQTFSVGLPSGRHAFYTSNTSFGLNLTNPTSPASVFDLVELALC
jgi:D-alanyl-D-alanine carboxypeptidase